MRLEIKSVTSASDKILALVAATKKGNALRSAQYTCTARHKKGECLPNMPRFEREESKRETAESDKKNRGRGIKLHSAECFEV